MTEHGLLRAGHVGAPHGLDGSFHVAGPSPALLKLGTAVRVGDDEFTIDRRAGHDNGVILRFAGVGDRTAALRLRGQELMVSRGLAPPLEDDEWWAEDLEGCRVADGPVDVGLVEKLIGLPSCEVLEVRRVSGGPLLLVPLVADAVRSVDVKARLIDIDLAFLGEEPPAPDPTRAPDVPEVPSAPPAAPEVSPTTPEDTA